MNMTKKIIKWIAALLTLILVVTGFPSHKITALAKQPEVASFEDNRFVKYDGTRYIRIKDVSRKGATVILYEADPDDAFTMNYQPTENRILLELRFACEQIEEGFQDDKIAECIDERLVGNTEFGRICFYLSPDGMELYVRDETGGQYGTIEGSYRYVPYVTVAMVEDIEWEKRVREVDPSTITEDYRGDVAYKKVNTRIVRKPDTKRTVWKPYDRGYWQTELQDILEGCYVRFEGYAWVESAVIENESEYRDYHLHQRKPWCDELICDTAEDEDIVISTRKRQFMSQKNKRAGAFSFVYNNNKQTNSSYTALYLERGITVSNTVTLSWGDSGIGYYFGSIDWSEHGEAYPDEVAFVSGDMNEIVFKKTIYPEMRYTGGIAYQIDFEIHMHWEADGTIAAQGTIIAHGEGTEVITYSFDVSAVDFVPYSSKKPFDKWVPVTVYIPEEEIIPGECVEESVFAAFITELVPHKEYRYVTQWNDWPDDTDGEEVPETCDADDVLTDNPQVDDPPVDNPPPEDIPDPDDPEGDDSGNNPGDEPNEEGTSGDDSNEDIIDIDRIEVLDNSFIESVYASTELTEGSVTHRAENLFDGDRKTAWIEDVDGYGEGETVTVHFTEEVDLVGFEIANGYFKSQKLYDANSRIATLRLEIGEDGWAIIDLISSGIDVTTFEYSDVVMFDQIYHVSSISFIIMEAIPGTKYEDTCISELTFLIQQK